MKNRQPVSKNMTMLLVYGRPPLVSAAMICAIAVMWTQNPFWYLLGMTFLLASMGFDLIDGWFAARFIPGSKIAQLADRVMDKIVYSIIFPLIAAGTMWRISLLNDGYTKIELLHAIFVLMLCITVLIRDNFAHFMRSFAIRKEQEPELRELTRLRTIVAAPLGALLYAYAFHIPVESSSPFYTLLSWPTSISLRYLFIIEIIFLIINFGSIAGFCRRYGSMCLDELCMENVILRRRILSFFPNALTTMNAIMGLLAVFFAYQGRMKEALLILIGSVIFDKLDGAMARKLGLTEPVPEQNNRFNISFGGIMDDIADSVSFCIAPAWIFYIILTDFSDHFIPLIIIRYIAGFYAFAGIARLVYFTLDRAPIPGIFKGIPTPAAALLTVSPLVIFSQFAKAESPLMPYMAFFCCGMMCVTALIMNIYPIKYLHMGRYMDTHPLFARINAALVLVFAFTPYLGYFVFSVLVIYVFSPLFTWRKEFRLADKY